MSDQEEIELSDWASIANKYVETCDTNRLSVNRAPTWGSTATAVEPDTIDQALEPSNKGKGRADRWRRIDELVDVTLQIISTAADELATGFTRVLVHETLDLDRTGCSGLLRNGRELWSSHGSRFMQFSPPILISGQECNEAILRGTPQNSASLVSFIVSEKHYQVGMITRQVSFGWRFPSQLRLAKDARLKQCTIKTTFTDVPPQAERALFSGLPVQVSIKFDDHCFRPCHPGEWTGEELCDVILTPLNIRATSTAQWSMSGVFDAALFLGSYVDLPGSYGPPQQTDLTDVPTEVEGREEVETVGEPSGGLRQNGTELAAAKKFVPGCAACAEQCESCRKKSCT